MKLIAIIILIFANFIIAKSQDIFTLGTKYFNEGNYEVADSLFSKYIESFPKDRNGYFNYGVTKLYLHDTLSFCKEMLILRNKFWDKDATDLYFKFCCTTDTVFYDKDYLKTNKGKFRYTEIIESSRYNKHKTVYVHDKKSKGKTISINPSDPVNVVKSDIIAIYQLYNDNSKLYLFTMSRPDYPGGDDALSEYRSNSPFIQQAKKELNLNKFTAYIEYVVDSCGNIKDLKLMSTSYKLENVDTLMKYIDLFISNMPKQIPARYREENVNYLEKTLISFW